MIENRQGLFVVVIVAAGAVTLPEAPCHPGRRYSCRPGEGPNGDCRGTGPRVLCALAWVEDSESASSGTCRLAETA
jgi:hypothetical protein